MVATSGKKAPLVALSFVSLLAWQTILSNYSRKLDSHNFQRNYTKFKASKMPEQTILSNYSRKLYPRNFQRSYTKFKASKTPEQTRLLCIGITFKPTVEQLKIRAYENSAKMYHAFKQINAFLISSGADMPFQSIIWNKSGHSHHTILNSTRFNAHGTPFLSSIFQQVERVCPIKTRLIAYANADIMFDQNLEQTIKVLHDWSTTKNMEFMAVGRRSNHYLQGSLDLHEVNQVDSELDIDLAQDYFIMTRNLIDWGMMPAFVIGRRAYDNALVDWAYHNSILIDTTQTILALHQTTADGNRAGHSTANKDKEFNVQLPSVKFDHGSTNLAHYKTVWLEKLNCIGMVQTDSMEQVWPEIQSTGMKLPILRNKTK